MSQSKIACLIFVSLLLQSCMHGLLVQTKTQDYASLPALIHFSKSPEKFKAEVHVYDISLTGILVAKKINDGEVLVTFINEFGLKYFDARLKGPETEMTYCIKPLDKKIITNTLLHDLSVFFIPSSNKVTEKGLYALKNFSYQISDLQNNEQQVKEFNKKKLVSIYLQKSEEEYHISHPGIRIEISLKII